LQSIFHRGFALRIARKGYDDDGFASHLAGEIAERGDAGCVVEVSLAIFVYRLAVDAHRASAGEGDAARRRRTLVGQPNRRASLNRMRLLLEEGNV